jgi:peptidoglycan/xylan/chitin deacetylase (PgdA/CDA1 family)
MPPTLIYSALRRAGVPTLLRSVRPRAVLLAYHNVVSSAPEVADAPLHMPVDEFEQQMRWLSREFTCVTVRELVDQMHSPRSMRGLAAVTFDDGYAGVALNAIPVLRAHRVPATVCIVPGLVGRDQGFWWDRTPVPDETRRDFLARMQGDGDLIARIVPQLPSLHPELWPASWDTWQSVAGPGVEIAAHTMFHRNLTALDDANLMSEVSDSADAIATVLGERPVTFSYPYGMWNHRVRDAVNRAGFRAALTTSPGLVGHVSDVLALPRVSVPAGLTQATFESWASGLALRRAG